MIKRFSLRALALAGSLQSFSSLGAEQPKTKIYRDIWEIRIAAIEVYRRDTAIQNAEKGEPTDIRETWKIYNGCRSALASLEATRASKQVDSTIVREADIVLNQLHARITRASLCGNKPG